MEFLESRGGNSIWLTRKVTIIRSNTKQEHSEHQHEHDGVIYLRGKGRGVSTSRRWNRQGQSDKDWIARYYTLERYLWRQIYFRKEKEQNDCT